MSLVSGDGPMDSGEIQVKMKNVFAGRVMSPIFPVPGIKKTVRSASSMGQKH